MAQLELDIFKSREARDKGMQTAVDHAEAVIPDWSQKAYGLLQEFLKIHVGEFQAEEVRSHAALVDFPLPPHARAWGGVIARAARSNLIKQIGIRKVRNPKAHCANSAVWIKN